jgi:photosystem II stability/assembly factor-like uncharacterized protein
MKKIFLTTVIIMFCQCCFTQWQLSLTLRSGESLQDISTPTDNITWIVASNSIIYRTLDAGASWKRTVANGLAVNTFVSQLYAIDGTTAFLTMNTGFTGVGPGFIYKTNDGGRNWSPVFHHKGNCDIKIAMFNSTKGLMSCNFDSFDNSIPAGQSFYYTINGGNKWIRDSIHDPTTAFINALKIKGKQVAILDFDFFYYSANYGLSWSKQKLPVNAAPNNQMQFEDSDYAVMCSDNGFNIICKRPGSNKWITTTGVAGGLVSCIALDGKECWAGEALDKLDNFYSSDSVKTFTPFIADPNAGFQFLAKSRSGKMLVGGTPGFTTGRIWINKRTGSEPIYSLNKIINSPN